VVLGLVRDLLGQLAARHLRHADLLDHHRAAGDGDRDVLLAQPQSPPQGANCLGDRPLIHDRPVDDRLRQEGLHAEGLELQPALVAANLDGLDAARPDVEPHTVLPHSLPASRREA